MKPESILFAGAIPREIQKQAEERRIQCIDFLQEQSVITQNTIAAAEGILAEAITRSPRLYFRAIAWFWVMEPVGVLWYRIEKDGVAM